MSSFGGRLDILAVLACLLIGCTQVTDPETAPLTLTVVQKDEATGEEAPLDGVRLCEADTEDCDWTGPDGNATVQLPLGKPFTFTLQKEGWPSYSAGGLHARQRDSARGVPDTFVMQTDEE